MFDLQIYLELRIPFDFYKNNMIKEYTKNIKIVGNQCICKLFCYNYSSQSDLEVIINKIVNSYPNNKEIKVITKKEIDIVIVQHSSTTGGIQINLPTLQKLAKEQIGLVYTKYFDRKENVAALLN